MQLPQVLLTVVLVAAGIFAYDAIRGDETVAPAPVAGPISAPSPEGAADDPPPMRLEGRGEAWWRAEFDRRLAALESEPDDARTDVVADAGGLLGGDFGVDGALPPELVEVLERATGETFDARDVVAFRALLEHVENQRRHEQLARGVDRFLERLDYEFSDEQRQHVLAATEAFREKSQAMRRDDTSTSREDRRETFQRLRDEFQTEVAKVIPASEAEELVSGLVRVAFSGGRFLGGGPPRSGPASSGGGRSGGRGGRPR